MSVFKDLAWKIIKIIIEHVLLWDVKIDVKGLENLPNEKGVLAANHNHMYDSLILPLIVYKYTHRKIHTFSQYKTWVSPFKLKLLRKIEKGLFKKNLTQIFLGDIFEQIPVCSGIKALNRKAYKKAGQYLRKGDFIAVFPQGDIKNRKKGQLYDGIAKVAVYNKAPIIPILLWNDGKKDTISIKKDFKKYKVVIGKPVTYFLNKEFKHKNQFKSLAKTILDEIYKLS